MRYVRKAILAAGFTFAGTLGGLMGDGDLTLAEALIAAGAALTAAYGVYRVPNVPPEW